MKRLFTAIAALAISTVSAHASSVGVFGDRFNINVIDNFYGGLSGVSSSILPTLDSTTVAGLDLLWAVQPANSYTAAQLSAMESFLGGGGRIAFMGEHGTFAPAENNRINAALASFGSTMSITNVVYDGGFRNATRTNGQINDFFLTEGVNTYNYAAFAPLSLGANGVALMQGQEPADAIMMAYENVGGGSIFLITDQNVWDNVSLASNDNARMFENLLRASTVPTPPTPAVPLPAAAWLLLSGVAGLGAVARRRKVA